VTKTFLLLLLSFCGLKKEEHVVLEQQQSEHIFYFKVNYHDFRTH